MGSLAYMNVLVMSTRMFQVEDIAALLQSLIFGQGMASEDIWITRRVIVYGGGGIRYYCPSLSTYFKIKLLNLLPKGKTKQDVATSIKK